MIELQSKIYLHSNINDFRQALELTYNVLGRRVSLSYIEKDYYVFMVLKHMSFYNDELMFKGGTSLSKAWDILNVQAV